MGDTGTAKQVFVFDWDYTLAPSSWVYMSKIYKVPSDFDQKLKLYWEGKE